MAASRIQLVNVIIITVIDKVNFIRSLHTSRNTIYNVIH